MDTDNRAAVTSLLTRLQLSLQTLRTIRLALGITAAVAVAYGHSWPLSFMMPLLTVLFLAGPVWISWNTALKILILLGISLLIGVFISEYLLHYPLLCVPLYVLLFFLIYYNDTPSSPPMVSLFMTLGITMIPIMSFSGAIVSHIVALFLFINMAIAMFFAWLFHSILPDTLAKQPANTASQKTLPKPAEVSEHERIRLTLVSTIVGSTAVIIFFSLSLSQFGLAMLLICIMAGNPSHNASLKFVKANASATLIGGIAVILAYNLLVVAPTYLFLVFLVLFFSLFFSSKIYSGSPLAPAFQSGFTTFLVLLGSSTGGEDTASSDFYLRIAQILFAGLFTIFALMLVEQLLRTRSGSVIVPE